MYTIYCDMDGVIADFEKGYAELTNTKPSKSFNGKQEFWKPISDAGASFCQVNINLPSRSGYN